MNNAINETPVPDTRASVNFLELMLGEATRHLIAIGENGLVTPASFEQSEDLETGDWISGRQGRDNIYFHVNFLRPNTKNIKAKKSDIVAARCIHVDIDHAEGRSVLEAVEPKPSAVVFSGGGYQAYWLLKEPTTDLEVVERCNLGMAKKVGGDKCHNIDRIMRVPGTVNIPNAKKRKAGRVEVVAHLVSELTDWSRVYQLEDFPQAGLAGVEVSSLVVDGQIKPFDLASLGFTVPDELKSLILHGDDAQRPMGSADAHFPSRSEAVYRVTCDLARLGAPDAAIAGVLCNPEYGISASIREKKNLAAYVGRQILSAKEAISKEWPDITKIGNPRKTFRNTILGIRRLGLHAEYDEFHIRKRLGGQLLQAFAHQLTDDACAVLRREILDSFKFDPGKENTHEAANVLALENRYHPIREYLAGLKWDGKPRIAVWLHTYLGAEDTELTQVIGKIMLIAAVRRIRQPGVKFDTIVVLEGKQGSGKSTALRILAGEDNFSDQDLLTLDAKTQVEAMEGIWIFELCELEGLSRADTNKVKAFASRSVDRARRAYGRFRQDTARQNIFVGTTNDDQYLRDMTGNRRFWPIKTSTIDLEALARDRDQLWAEAAYWEEKEEGIQLPRELWSTAAKEQEARLEEDPWIEALIHVTGETHGEFERISTHLLLNRDLQIPPERMQQYHSKRLAHVMRKLGWDGPQNLKFRGGKTLRGYQRKLKGPTDE